MKKLVTVTSKKLEEKLKNKKDITLLYPLENYTIGYENYFNIEDIDDFVLINRILNDEELDNLANILKLSKIKGIVFDDLGILEVIKDLNIKKILLLDHLATNSISINYYLDYVDSVVVSSDLSYDEIESITRKAQKEVVIYAFGLKKLMYSRRNLLSNYATYQRLENKEKIDAKIEDKKFVIKEDKYGTSFYMGKYYNGLELLNLNNVLYFWYDLNYLDIDNALDIILNNKVSIETTTGFLHQELTYKVRGKDND